MNIISLLDLYLQNKKELECIKADIKRYEKQWKPRIDELKKLLGNHEEKILEWLNENNHPGLKYQGLLFELQNKHCLETKSKISRKKKEQHLTDIKKSFSLSDECYDVLYNNLLGKQKEVKKLSLKK